MTNPQLRAGIGRTNITPSLIVPHAGWGAQTHVLADGVHRPLFVDVLLLDEGADSPEGRRTAIVSFDLVGLYGLVDGVAEHVASVMGWESTDVRVTVTHNHANPVMWNNWIGGGREVVEAYRSGLATAAAGAAREAWLAMRPVRTTAGTGRCAVSRNRRQTIENPDGSKKVIVGRNDDGIVDPDVTMVRIDTLDGEPYAAVMGYACHPTIMGPDNKLVSPDYPGVAKAVFEQATGARSVFLQGATGNVGPREGFTGDVSVVERLGKELGLAAAAIHAGLDTRPVDHVFSHPRESGATLGIWRDAPREEPSPRFAAGTMSVLLPLRPQPPVDEAQATYAHWQRELERVHLERRPAPEIEATMFQARRAQMAVSRSRTFSGRSTIEVTLHGVQLGDALLIGCNGEPFCEIGLAVRQESTSPVTFFGGYTGESLGYIPWPDAYDAGGYEVETTPYTKDAAPLLVAAAERLGEQLNNSAQAIKG